MLKHRPLADAVRAIAVTTGALPGLGSRRFLMLWMAATATAYRRGRDVISRGSFRVQLAAQRANQQ